MVDIRKEGAWRELLEKDEEIRDLASRSGLTENPERVYALWQAMESGKKIRRSMWEASLAIYLYCHYS